MILLQLLLLQRQLESNLNETLNQLVVTNDHFMHALSICDPSTLRENKVEVSFILIYISENSDCFFFLDT